MRLLRYEKTAAGPWPARPLRDLGPLPEAGLSLDLPPGSYLLELTGAPGPVTRLPLQLGRGEDLALTVPLPARVPAGMVYVPPGRFLYGSGDEESFRRDVLKTQPQHAVETAGYFIGRTEVTNGEWLTFLRALPPLAAYRGVRNNLYRFEVAAVRSDGSIATLAWDRDNASTQLAVRSISIASRSNARE